MPEVLASTDFSSIFLYLELSLSWNSSSASHGNSNCGSLELWHLSRYGRTAKEIHTSTSSVSVARTLPQICTSTNRLQWNFHFRFCGETLFPVSSGTTFPSFRFSAKHAKIYDSPPPPLRRPLRDHSCRSSDARKFVKHFECSRWRQNCRRKSRAFLNHTQNRGAGKNTEGHS
jgi:hypothetical protein